MARLVRQIRGQSSTPLSYDQRIAGIAQRQHGVVSRAQLLAAGVPAGAIEARLRAGRLHPLHRGVYAVGHRAVGRRGLEMAAVLACGDGTVLSHHPAAALWGIRGAWRGPVHVVAAHDRKRRGIVVHRARHLHPRDTTRHHGIPITTPARTLLDLADHLPPRALDHALAQAEVLRLTSRDELRALVERSPGRRGTLAALLARDAGGPTRSELERRFLAFLDAHGLARPLVNRRIEGYEVDFHWPDARLVVELDGYAFHAHREAFENDRARDATLQAHGWRVVRLTDRRLAAHPGAVAELLERLLGAMTGALRGAMAPTSSPPAPARAPP